MKVYAVIEGEYDDRFTEGIFSTWAKAYDFAMNTPKHWRPFTEICVYEVDGDIIWGPKSVIEMAITKGDKAFCINPKYSADIDPTENINQQGGQQ